MARKQCFLVCLRLGNNVSWCVHFRETWVGTNVIWLQLYFLYRLQRTTTESRHCCSVFL